jgi:hypothetical protein
MVVMEAENYDNNDANYSDGTWSEATSYSGYVDDGYMSAPGDGDGNGTWSGSPTGGAEIGYDIDFSTSGTYYIWMRAYFNNGGSNSCYVGVDDTQVGGSFSDGTYGSWHWVEHGTTVSISTGEHTFQVRRRETNTCVDRIILTTDSEYTPSGNGPDESPRGSSKAAAPPEEILVSEPVIPENFRLSVYPNPFNPNTTIYYSLPVEGHVELSIYDITGRKVTEFSNGYQAAGEYTYNWEPVDANGRQLTSGVYFLHINAGEYRQTVKMLYAR